MLALGIIILISIALGLGVVLLIALIAILISLWERRGESRPILLENDEKDEQVRPSSLLANINQATTNIARGSTTNAQTLAPTPIIKLNDQDTGKGKTEEVGEMDDSFNRSYSTGASTSDNPPQISPADLNNGVGYRCYSRYDFAGDRQGEIPLIVGQQVQVLNDSDQDWFFVRDPASTHEGVVPSSYLF